MGKWVPDSYLDLILNLIAGSDEECVCSQQPLTYFNAVWPGLWALETTYAIGDLVRPPTQNGFIYECVVGGDSGATEPGWGISQDNEFTDGTVTWKTHENYSLANVEMVPADFIIGPGDVVGRKLSVGIKMSVVTHTAGAVSHTALIQNDTKTLHFVTTSQTTLGGGNEVEEGRTTIFFAFDVPSYIL